MKLWRADFWKKRWQESGLGEGDRLNCMFDAFLCIHLSVDLNDWQFCCASKCECLCIHHSSCCLVNAPFKPASFTRNTGNGEYCKLVGSTRTQNFLQTISLCVMRHQLTYFCLVLNRRCRVVTVP